MVGRSVVRAAPALIGIAAIGPVLVILTFQRPTGPASASNPAGLSTNAPLASGLAQFSGEGFTMDYPETWHYYPLNFVAATRFSVAGYLASQPIDTSAICHATPNSASCDFGAYALDPGQAAIEVSYRGGMFGSESPVDFWDHSNDGRRVNVGGVPAVISVALGADRTTIGWKISRPGVFDNWIQLDADIRGAGLGARPMVEAIVNSMAFVPPPAPLELGQREQIGNAALAALRARDAEAYACFPPVGEQRRTMVNAIPTMAFNKPLDAVCSASIAATDIDYWELSLTLAWGPDLTRPTFRTTVVQWLEPDGTLSGQTGGGGDIPPNCCH